MGILSVYAYVHMLLLLAFIFFFFLTDFKGVGVGLKAGDVGDGHVIAGYIQCNRLDWSIYLYCDLMQNVFLLEVNGSLAFHTHLHIVSST